MNHNYPTWIEISKSALEHNLTQYKSVVGSHLLAPVIKANAYGHGLLEIGRICQENQHVDWLCTANLSDALTLRNNGITKPLLILSCIIDSNLEHATDQNIDFVIYNKETAQHLSAIGKKNNYCFGVHIKVDTGLARLGIEPEQALLFIQELRKLPFIKINGICTHFAESQKKDSQFTYTQLKQFNAVLNTLENHGITIPYKHTANSAATTTLDLSFCNLFRVGIGAYGLWPSSENKVLTQNKYPHFNLKPVLTWKTRIIDIKKMPTLSYIGYDRTYLTTQEIIIATVPIGYYDGYDFRLFNQACMLVKNKYARVIGRISMNLTTLNVSTIPEVTIGDEVIIMGNYPQVSARELGMQAGNPNVREITTKINNKIPRIIVQ